MTIADWISQNVTDDPRALRWFEGEECEGRIVRAYGELLSGYDVDTSTILKTTCPVQDKHQGIVKVHDINFYSICAHHFLPFFGRIDVTYVPGDRILGLGKFPRLVDAYSRRFQIQEHLVKEIAEEVVTSGGAKVAYVQSEGRHMCMCSRGPSDHTALTTTSWIAGDPEELAKYSAGA